MNLKAILNKGDGIYLETAHILSLGINEIQVDHNGNTAFAILAYPSPGAGYKVALFNDEQKCLDEFNKLVGTVISGGSDGTTYAIESDFVAPTKPKVIDAPVIGQADLTTVEELVENAVPCEGENCEDCDECTCENHEETEIQPEEIQAEVETQVTEAVEEVNEEVGAPVFG